MKILILIGFLIVLFVGFLIFISILDGKKWDKFKLEHNCKVVANISGSTGISTSGKVISLPGKTGWLCDDGITYYR